MLQVSSGPEPSLFAGAHHQAFENTDFRISGRDMYHVPTVNVNITTPSIPTAPKFITANDDASVTGSSESHADSSGGMLGRLARLLRSRGGRKSQNACETPGSKVTTTSPTISGPPLSSIRSNSTTSEGGDDFKVSSIEGFDNQYFDPRSLSNAEVYVRCLSSSKGLACWQPKPLRRFSGPDGIVPGDVGTFSAEDGFRKTFNIWEDAESIRESGETTSDRRFQPPSEDIACHEEALQEGETVIQGAVSETTTTVADGRRRTSAFEFRCHSPQGAVLALTSSAHLFEAVHQTELHDTILQHAELLYRHAESIRRVGPEESLYIVTSCLKSDSWALAAYKDPMGPPSDALRLVQIGWDDHPVQPNPIYAWTKRGTSEAKCGESVGGRRVKDQSLFLRGFKLSFSQGFRARVKGERLSNSRFSDPGSKRGSEDGDGGDYNNDDGPRKGSDRGGNSSANPFGGRGGTAPGRVYDTTEGVHIQAFPENRSEVYHACDSINKFLLDKTGADFALSHDDDWRFHTRRHTTWNGFISDLLRRVEELQRVSVSHGVAFLKAETSALARPEDLLWLVFLDSDTPLFRWYPSTSHDVEVLQFSIPPSWLPAPMPTDLHLQATLGPLQKGEEESLVIAFHRFLAFYLMIRSVRSVNGRGVLLYSGSDNGVSLFDCPPDPTLVVLGATWHTLRVWDGLLERLTSRMLTLEGRCRGDSFIPTPQDLERTLPVSLCLAPNYASGIPKKPHPLPLQSSFIQELDAIDELHEQFTQSLQDFIEDLPFSGDSQEPSAGYSEDCVAQRALFLDGECESLHREITRLQSICAWQETMLTGLTHLVANMPPPLDTAESPPPAPKPEKRTRRIEPRDAREAPHDRIQRWLESASRNLRKKRPHTDVTTPTQEPDSSTHPKIIKLQLKALENIMKHRAGHSDTLKELLHQATRCRKAITTCVARGDFRTAFVRLTQAHTLLLRLVPRHPDYQTGLKEDEKRGLTFNGQDMVWELQDLEAKILQGSGTQAVSPALSQDPPGLEFEFEVDGLAVDAAEDDGLAHLLSPSGQTPGPTLRPTHSGAVIWASDEPFGVDDEWYGTKAQGSSESSDPCLWLEEVVKGLFGKTAKVDYSFECRRIPGANPEYIARASIQRPGVSGWPREIGIERGETPELAIEGASRGAYEVLRTVYPGQWVEY